MILLHVAAAALYGVAAWAHRPGRMWPPSTRTILVAVALALHFVAFAAGVATPEGLDLSLPHALSIVAALTVLVALASGGQAVVILTGVKPGEPDSMTAEEREQRRQQLANQAARAELTGYAGNLRAAATVRIPDEILNPPAF